MKLATNYKFSYVKLICLIFRLELIIRLINNIVDLKSRILNKFFFFNYYDKYRSYILKLMTLFFKIFGTVSRRYNCLVCKMKFFIFSLSQVYLYKRDHNYLFFTTTIHTNGLNNISNSETNIFENENNHPSEPKSHSNKVISIVDNQIRKVLVGPMPTNKHINSARDTLKLMIDSLSEDSVIYKFILEQIKVPYQFNATVQNDKLVPNNSVNWKSLSPFTLPYLKGGTYLFNQGISKEFYIGSASNHTDRVIQHLEQFRGVNPRSLHTQEKDRQNTLLFSIIHETPSLVKIFRQKYTKYNLSKGEYEILLAFTLFPSRVLEQDLIDQFKPTINGKGGKYDLTVTHKFTNWLKSNLNKNLIDNRGSIPVNILNLDGSLEYSANSLNDARKY